MIAFIIKLFDNQNKIYRFPDPLLKSEMIGRGQPDNPAVVTDRPAGGRTAERQV